ncbi:MULTISPECIES: mechanosensitive ion channel family protein [Okeania]|uniref:mechanosensitive ion channel family protein n=1 Tax=Okeania TaxID=1458928 RepID=UPI000F535A15|nr:MULTISPECIES: mechanosensitive ion channel family protein [Okeania]NEP04488.1 mechanosensitive ion channel family protein [Okeania sp. SIO4D6]NEP74198.1 mechanosensitive ion channel family protein [Okeania sp. SIO2G5]NEP95075.1 mechanosensitive ion channel family protein [Okeania sp. SIO2F5]NEQ92890.1 mechanosensitive ion channel family protein [Okeania sp. SIO2G4]NET74738.1 mechanosensitive ion channel family protein [Okeania sp. SIO1F9]
MQIYKFISFKQLLIKQNNFFNRYKISKIITVIIVSLFTFILITNQTFLALGQTSETLQNNNIENITQVPSLTPISNIVYKPIKIDGREIFKVAAVAGQEIQGNSNTSPLNIRVRLYENNLKQTIKNCFDADTLKLTLETRENQTLVFASDAEQLKNKFLIAITDLDAQIHGISREDLTNQIIGFMKDALIRAQRERQPDYLLRQILISLGIILALILLSFLISIWQKHCLKKYQKIQKYIENLKVSRPQVDEFINYQELTTAKTELTLGQKQQLRWEQQQDKNSFFRSFLQVSHLILWLSGIIWILGNFPHSRWLQIFLVSHVIVFTIIIGTYLAIKGSPVMVNWFAINSFKRLENQSYGHRKIPQAITFSHTLKGIVMFTLGCIGMLWIFQNFNVSITIVLLGLGIISFTVSLGGHNLVKDIISGILILLEDQYAIGDLIDLDYTIGYVEDMSFRVTQLRDVGGRLSSIPNSNISIVHNFTKDWASIDLRIKVNLDSNLSQAVQLVKQVANELKNDAEWGDKVLDSASVLGVNSVSQTEVEFMIRMKSIPREQWNVAREFCYRLKQIFELKKIAFNATISSKYR